MNYRVFAVAALAALAAACGSSEGSTGGNAAAASGEQPRAQGASASASASASDGTKLQPGMWETTVETLSMEMPDMSPEEAAAMPRPQTTTTRSCLSPEDVAQPTGQIFAGMPDVNCSASAVSASAGRTKGSMTCSGGDMGGTMTMEWEGTFSETASQIEQTMKQTGEDMNVTTRTRMTSRRVGDCDPGKEG